MATTPDEPNGSRIWRGMRALIFGDDHETSLRDQIEDAIDASETVPTQRGDLSPIERQMLRNLLHFGDRTAGEVAVTRGDIISIPQTLNFAELVAAFAEAEHSRLPVTGEDLDDVIGMIHIKDVFAALANPGRPRTIEGLLRTPLFVPESMGVLDLLARMRTERTHLAIVVDEFGGTEGLITIEDVVEEIVGDIEDEHDEEATGNLILLEDGLWEADARTELEEVAETIDARLVAGEDDIDTLGGLAFLLAGRILPPGESILHPSGWRLESIDADTRRMIRLRLHAPEEGATAGQ
ncbi:MAG: hemolysin family protein [Sphingomicrobium sp.]